ncbi:MAG: D-aminoacyl-tRNA deacylase [Candidatus Omnitrophica bacterium]|nr:D-aminoacyl-tRNA deacylase [Candidatus Omnitrophota bacterium]
MIDTHCHLYFDAYDADRDAMLERARSAGVRGFVCVGIDPRSNGQALTLAQAHPDMIATAGLHPHSAHEATEELVGEVEAQIASGHYRAVGEIGLDYYKSQAGPEAQRPLFERLIAGAAARGLPVIVHSREALEDTRGCLTTAGNGRVRGVMHCYSYDVRAMRAFLDLGMHISFACNTTYPKAVHLSEAVAYVPEDRFVIETDSPYLPPRSLRGQRNEPAHLTELVAFIASRRGQSEQEVAEASERNARRLFAWERSK